MATAGPALAQSGANDAGTLPAKQAAAATRDTGTTNTDKVEQVVVTARRKAEKLQNVPLDVTAITATTLKAASARSLQDITFLTRG